MSVVGTFKQWLGIGGVKFEIQSDAQFPRTRGIIGGKLLVTSKSDQNLQKIDVKVIEEYSTGRGSEKSTRTLELGKATLPEGAFVIKAGESKVVDFEVPFKILKSTADNLQEKGGALGALGKGMSFVNAEKSNYFIVAGGDVKGTVAGPTARKAIQLV